MPDKQVLKRLCQCIGLASILLVVNYGGLLGGGYDVRMHVPYRLTGICLAQLADIFLLGLVFFIILAPLGRTRVFPAVQLLLAAVMPLLIIAQTRSQFPFEISPVLGGSLAFIWIALIAVLLAKFPYWYTHFVRLGDAVGIFFAIFAFCSIMQILWVLRWKPGPRQHTEAWATTAQPPRQHPLLVWIIFDELSYQQLFGDRAPGLALPNFDALRSQSTVFSDTQPVGLKTVKVIPSLLSGKVIDGFHFTFNNRFLVRYQGQNGFQPLTGRQTVFGDAQENGWRTAAVGWYNPYCTLYAGTIDDCYWMNLDRLDGPMAQRSSFWRNTWTPLHELLLELKSPAQAARADCSFDVRHRYQTNINLQQHAMRVLHTDQADFVFLHVAIPHSPNVWNRRQNTYTQVCGSSYLDNLALADRVLGGYLTTLEGSPRWNQTTLIVEGDHGWRVQLWDYLAAWTLEDEQASHRVFDTRAALLIHQAGQAQPQIVSTPWSLLNVHTFVEDVLHGRHVQF